MQPLVLVSRHPVGDTSHECSQNVHERAQREGVRRRPVPQHAAHNQHQDHEVAIFNHVALFFCDFQSRRQNSSLYKSPLHYRFESLSLHSTLVHIESPSGSRAEPANGRKSGWRCAAGSLPHTSRRLKNLGTAGFFLEKLGHSEQLSRSA